MAASANPYNDIPVSLSMGDYLAIATTFHGWGTAEWWKALADLLYGRPGWHCEIANTGTSVEMLWSFGALSSSLFVISSSSAPKIHLLDYDEDEEVEFESVDDLRAWLEVNEARHAEYPRRLKAYAADSDWALLRSLPFEVDVTVDGSEWITTFRTLPLTFSSADSLAESLGRARQAIANAFDAPPALAPVIKIVAHLDEEATAAL